MSAKIAIIPARGGSKRIPNKNIRHFLGQPIIAYSIEVALQCGLFEEVMVSTDSDEIADQAIKLGAKVPFMRSDENASDFATTYDLLEEVITKYQSLGKKWEFGCCIYPTAPFTTKENLQQGLKRLISNDFTTLFPIVAFEYPIWRGLTKQGDHVQMRWPEYQKSRSQDLESIYHDAGQWYWFNSQKMLEEGQLFTANSGYLELNASQVHDIDTEEDWKMAELKYKALHS